MKKRIVSLLLAVLMVLQLLPVAVAEDNTGGGVVVASNVLSGQTYHRVVFVNGSQTIAEQYVLDGQTLILPEAPAVESQRFLGWKAGGVDVTDATAVTADMTVEAVFEAIAHYTFTVLYKDEKGNTVASSVQRSYTSDDELPVNDAGNKYITIESPASVAEGEGENQKVLFPDKAFVTFELTGAANQEVTVTYTESSVGYTVKHYAMKRVELEGGTTTYTREGATEFESEQLKGAVGASIDPQPLDLAAYIFMEKDTLLLTNDESKNVVGVYYRPVRYILNYDSQGGSYVPHKSIGHGEGEITVFTSSYSSIDPAPTRTGYDFTGWYLDAACTQAAPASMTLTGDTTVYAGWEEKTVQYTIVYEKQVYNNATGQKDWVFHASGTGRGVVGSAPSVSRYGNAPSYYELDEEATAAANEGITIAADGSTVAYVRYRLRTYSIIFDLSDGRNTTGTITMGGKSYGTREYILSVVLGQNVSAVWPTPDRVTRSNGDSLNNWVNGNDNYKTARWEVTEDMLPSGSSPSITYYATWFTTQNVKGVQYWLQDVTGSYYYIDAGYSQVFVQSAYDNLNPKSLYGYTNISRTPTGSNPDGTRYPSSGDVDAINIDGQEYTHIYVYNFYYNRNQYSIEYRYNTTKLDTINDVYYGADISGSTYDWTPSVSSVGLASDWVFDDWYTDPECTSPYVFGTMPGNNLIVYAKFTPPQRTVTMNYQNGQNATSETVTLGGTVNDLPIPVYEGHVFLGWFTAPDGGTKFDLNMPITENMQIYARWQRMTLEYTVRYQDEQGNTVALEKVVSNLSVDIGYVVEEYPIVVSGYRPMQEKLTLSLTADANSNIITFTYRAQSDTKYTVCYLSDLDGSAIRTADVKTAGKELERVTEIAPANIIFGGKTWYPLTEVKSLELMGDESLNVITFTYLPYKAATVKVTFWYDGVQDTTLTREIPVRVGESVNAGHFQNDSTYTKGGIYKLQSTNPENITVTAEMDGTSQEMALYYVLNEAAYSVSHYLLGTTIPVSDGIMSKATIGTTIDTNAAVNGKLYADYKHAQFHSFACSGTLQTSGNAADLTISADASKNEVIIYYTLPVVVTANDATYTYDGTAKTVADANGLEYTASGLVNGDTVEADVDYLVGSSYAESATNAGTYTARVKSVSGLKGYYTYSTANGTLTINKATADPITATGYKGEYDGMEHYITVSGQRSDDTLEYRIINRAVGGSSAWSTSAPYMVDVDTVKSTMDIEVRAVNPNYETRTATATLEITPRSLTVSAKKTLPYNGALQTMLVTSSNAKGLVEGETLVLSGADISGKSVGVHTDINLDGYTCLVRKADGKNTSTHNYKISVSGQLTITARTVEFVGESATHYYNPDKTHEITGITANGLVAGHSYEGLTYSASGQEPGKYDGKFSGTVVIHDQDGADVTSNYVVEQVPGVLTIEKSEDKLHVVLSDKTFVYDGTAHSLDAAQSEVAGTTFRYSADGSSWVSNITELTQTDADSLTITVEATNDNYAEPATATATLTVVPRKVTLTSGSKSWQYNGEEHKFEEVTEGERGFVTGEGATYHSFNGISAAGREDNTFKYTLNSNTKASNYDITQHFGLLMVSAVQPPMVIQAASDEKVYDGTPLTNSGYTFVSENLIVPGDTLHVTVEGSQTDVGTALNRVTEIRVTNAAGKDVTTSYRFDQSRVGNLVVTERAATLTGESGTRTYTGRSQSLTGITPSGLLEGHYTTGLTYAATGTNVGEYDGVFRGTLVIRDASGADVTANYTVTTTPGKLTITPATSTLSLKANGYSGVYDGQPHGITVTGLQARDVLWYSLDGVTWTTDAPTRTNVQAAETIYIEARNPNYKDRKTTAVIEITPVALTVYAEDTAEYDGKDHSVTLTATDLTSGSLVNGETLTISAALTESEVGVHEKNVTATWSVAKGDGSDSTGNYTLTASAKLTITARAVAFTGESGERTYNGKEQELTGITPNGLVDGHEWSALTYRAAGTDVEGSPYKGDFTGTVVIKDAAGKDVTKNYTVSKTPGELTILPIGTEIIITAKSDTKTYDGAALVLDAFTFTENVLVDGDVLDAVIEGSQTNAGYSANKVTDWTVTRDGKDVTANYTFGTPVNGKLTVEKRTVTLTAGSSERVYNGKVLTNKEVTVSDASDEKLYTIEGDQGVAVSEPAFVPGEGVICKTWGARLDAGTAQNILTYTAQTGTLLDNYEIIVIHGELTVLPISTKVVVKALSDEQVYDGTALTASYTYTSGVLLAGETLVAETEGSQINVGSSANKVVSWKVVSEDGTDISQNYTGIVTEDGTLTVTPRPVTFTGESGEREYRGTAWTLTGIEADAGLLTGHSWSGLTYAASGIDRGTYPGAFSGTLAITDGSGNNVTANYVPECKEGALVITPSMVEVTITALNASKTYDGTALTQPGYTWDKAALMADETVKATTSGSRTDAGEGVNTIATWAIMRGDKDVSANYANVTLKTGTLTVYRREVILRSGSAEKEYDGEPLTHARVSVEGEGFANGEGASITVTGYQLWVGSSANTFTYALKAGTKAGNYIISTVCGTLTVTGDSLINDKSTPAVESNYDLGEAIPYTITVQNVRDAVLSGVTVTDNNAVLLPGAGYTVDGHTAFLSDMQRGQTIVINAQHIVTEADILAGTVHNVATVTWKDETFYPDETTDDIADVDATLSVSKTSDVAADAQATLGQTITYAITVKNDGNVTFHNILVKDELAGVQLQSGSGYTVNGDGTATIASLGVGKAVTLTATYTVTSDDILAGHVYNVATAKGEPVPDPDDPDTPKVPENEDEEDTDVEPIDTSLSLIKDILGVRSNGGYWNKKAYELHDEVWYAITVTNEGNVPYKDIVVTDVRTGLLEVIDHLAVGESVTFYTSLFVDEEHVFYGRILNEATAKGEIDGDPDPSEPEPTPPEGEDEAEAPTEPEDYTVPLGSMVMNVGECFE